MGHEIHGEPSNPSTKIQSGLGPVTVSVTSIATSGCAGSDVNTQSHAVCSPPPRPVESTLTVTSSDSPASTLSASGDTSSHAMSSAALQSAFADSKIE